MEHKSMAAAKLEGIAEGRFKESEIGVSSGEEGTNRQKPLAKRPRTTGPSLLSTQKSSSKPTAKGRKSLSLLPAMPLDLLFEIIGFLTPKDIISVSRTNKLFRETLRSRNATTVWKAARGRLGVPEPPSDMLEAAWAALLFGNVCQHCGARNIQQIDFLLRRRLCTTCKKRHLIVASRLKVRFPGVDKSVLDFISHTNVGGWAHGHRSSSQFYWAMDVEKIVQKLSDHDQGGSLKSLDDFKAQRIQLVQEIQSNAARYQKWFTDTTREHKEDRYNRQDQRRHAVFERFMQLGYTREEISAHQFLPEFNNPTPLTERIWQQVRARVEPKLLERKQARLDKELAAVKNSRIQIVHGLYTTFKSFLRPSQWRYLPRSIDICRFKPFARIINSPADSRIGAKDFDQAMADLPELLSAASDAKKRRLRDLLPAEINFVPFGQGDVSSELDHLDLAISVFECYTERGRHDASFVLVGVEDIMTHHCNDDSHGLASASSYRRYPGSQSRTGELRFSKEGSAVASTLVHLAGLDSRTASAADLDEKDLRFACSRCLAQKGDDGTWSRCGYSWRTAISHGLTNSHTPSSDLSWTILSNQDADATREKERSDPKWDRRLWTCSHCSAYMGNLQSRSVILQHLETEHNISTPTEPQDLFLFERFRRLFWEEITFPVDEPNEDR
ncbi:hypothetical protein GALMADRAFT_145149 [Galerina marginata CBS 339.88]|uniref:F-box domain-containing protein n=1 Tax=Galerina marginata (strain CBS 339.88) TaxID=685588 RepID=A0A067SSI5_GALM3|nr:hypothetical protein GALMADRAFT_145149 [Galerina marginata CBS 339.88]